MCYNGLSSRATDLVPARPLMLRRPAVLLTSPRSTSPSSLFCAFCAPLQKSEAHPFYVQSLPASLQKPRVCRHKRFSLATRHPSLATSASSSLFITLLHQCEGHPLPFQSLAHSLCVYPGCHPERSLISREEPPAPRPISGHFLHFLPPERSPSPSLSITYTLLCRNTGMPPRTFLLFRVWTPPATASVLSSSPFSRITERAPRTMCL
jgi:hypothetical protein